MERARPKGELELIRAQPAPPARSVRESVSQSDSAGVACRGAGLTSISERVAGGRLSGSPRASVPADLGASDASGLKVLRQTSLAVVCLCLFPLLRTDTNTNTIALHSVRQVFSVKSTSFIRTQSTQQHL